MFVTQGGWPTLPLAAGCSSTSSCLYYLRLEVEKLDLRVVPALFFFFFSFFSHTAPLHTPTMPKPI